MQKAFTAEHITEKSKCKGNGTKYNRNNFYYPDSKEERKETKKTTTPTSFLSALLPNK